MSLTWKEAQEEAKGSGISQAELAKIWRNLNAAPIVPSPDAPPLPVGTLAGDANVCNRMTPRIEWLMAYRNASPAKKAVMTRSLKRACEDTSGCAWNADSKTCTRGRSASPKRSRKGAAKRGKKAATKKAPSKRTSAKKSAKKRASTKKAAKPKPGSLDALRAKRDARGFDAFTKPELLQYFSKTRASALRKRGTAKPLPKNLKDMTKTELVKRAAKWYK